MEAFLASFASVMVNFAGLQRVIIPALSTLEQILSSQLLACYEHNPDASPALRVIVERVSAVSFKMLMLTVGGTAPNTCCTRRMKELYFENSN